jgi:hypothetical protein
MNEQPSFWGRFSGRHKTSGMTTGDRWLISDTDLTMVERVDAKLARDIWHNTAKSYKLSASVVICAIKAVVDYVGAPIVKMSGPVKQQKVIQKHIKAQRKTAHRKMFTEGNEFIWVNFNSDTADLEYIYFGMDDLETPYLDVDTKELKAVSFKQNITFFDKYNNTATTTRRMFFDENQIITEYLNNIPPGKEKRSVFKHNYGVLPVIWGAHGKGDDEVQGHGMIEPVEPYLANMHTIMENRIIEDKRSSRKKYLITGEDPDNWLSKTCLINGIKDQKGGVPLEDLDIFFNTVSSSGKKEEVSYLNPGQTATDSIQILKLLFMNLIETLRVPEFVYPPKLGASFASAQIQVPTFIQLIQEDQEELSSFWRKWVEISSMVLSRATNSQPVSVDGDVKWKRIDLDSAELRAKIVNYMMSSMKIAKDEGLMNDEEIRAYIDSYMNQLQDYDEWEKGRDKMLKDLEGVKKAFSSSKEVATENKQEGDSLIENENREKGQ